MKIMVQFSQPLIDPTTWPTVLIMVPVTLRIRQAYAAYVKSLKGKNAHGPADKEQMETTALYVRNTQRSAANINKSQRDINKGFWATEVSQVAPATIFFDVSNDN